MGPSPANWASTIRASPAALTKEFTAELDRLSRSVASMGSEEPYRTDLAEAIVSLRRLVAGSASWHEDGVIAKAALVDAKPRIEQAVTIATGVRLAWSTAVLSRTESDKSQAVGGSSVARGQPK